MQGNPNEVDGLLTVHPFLPERFYKESLKGSNIDVKAVGRESDLQTVGSKVLQFKHQDRQEVVNVNKNGGLDVPNSTKTPATVLEEWRRLNVEKKSSPR